ncbi:MAG: DEAD/DEAH box helicase family protein [Proteobacteria bacterium]|nr:DEAD/DEAH box helicase family protein [Pseudomonadota bacterium]
MDDYINSVFGPDGVLAHRFEGYVPRQGQIDLALAVDGAIRDGEHVMAEAPTGTGKSIGYSVPATYHAAHEGKRVVIATANIALQEQLVNKDLPLLADILPWDFSFALIKGRSNYLCHDRLYQEEAQGTLELLDDPSDAGMLEALVAWARRTATGDVSELSFEPPYRLWRRFSTSSEDCKGSDCRFRDECCALKARAAAQEADVVVCNYHLLFAHLQVREATEKDIVLPPFGVAILDEAHKAADIARDFFGFRVTQGSVRWAARLLKKIGEARFHEHVVKEAERFFTRLAQHRRSPAYKTRLRTPDVVPCSELVRLLGEVCDGYVEAISETSDVDLRADLKRAAARCNDLAHQIGAALSLTDSEAVSFIEEDSRGGGVLCSKPIHVGERLRHSLFGENRTVVLTSATLTTGGSFDHLREEIGVPDPRELVVDTPFDFQRQALLVVPDGMPEPNDPAYPAAVAALFAEVMDLADGRTLGLFTSYRNLNATYERVCGNGHRVLKQGDMPRTALVEEFRRDVGSVLLGTESFWAGVDVPGEALSCVVIDRLPFPSPDDPVLDAISERDRRWFTSYSLPRAVIAFKQGFGRLIRTAADRGVVVVLDRRLVSKPYGRVFTASLPDVLKSRRLENVRHFLEEAA